MKKNKSEELSEDFPTKEDIENAQNLARRTSPVILGMLEAETDDESEIPEKVEDAD